MTSVNSWDQTWMSTAPLAEAIGFWRRMIGQATADNYVESVMSHGIAQVFAVV
jgi:hypothetical protein